MMKLEGVAKAGKIVSRERSPAAADTPAEATARILVD
jgi:hypothetical protein